MNNILFEKNNNNLNSLVEFSVIISNDVKGTFLKNINPQIKKEFLFNQQTCKEILFVFKNPTCLYFTFDFQNFTFKINNIPFLFLNKLPLSCEFKYINMLIK